VLEVDDTADGVDDEVVLADLVLLCVDKTVAAEDRVSVAAVLKLPEVNVSVLVIWEAVCLLVNWDGSPSKEMDDMALIDIGTPHY